MLYLLLCSLQGSQCINRQLGMQDDWYNCEVLPDTTSLMFQWYPKKFEQSIPDENEKRLMAWSEREQKRSIYLVVHGAGLSPERIQELTNMFQHHPTIYVVDFNTIDLGDNDFTLSIGGQDYKISQLLRYRYEQELKKNKLPENMQKKCYSSISISLWDVG